MYSTVGLQTTPTWCFSPFPFPFDRNDALMKPSLLSIASLYFGVHALSCQCEIKRNRVKLNRDTCYLYTYKCIIKSENKKHF